MRDWARAIGDGIYRKKPIGRVDCGWIIFFGNGTSCEWGPMCVTAKMIVDGWMGEFDNDVTPVEDPRARRLDRGDVDS